MIRSSETARMTTRRLNSEVPPRIMDPDILPTLFTLAGNDSFMRSQAHQLALLLRIVSSINRIHDHFLALLETLRISLDLQVIYTPPAVQDFV